METRALGEETLQIVPLMLGGNVFGWTADQKTSFRVLDAFVDRGFNAIDTADVYSVWVPGHTGGESEAVLGRWFEAAGKRDKVVLATKVGMKMPDGEGLRAERIVRSVEASLERLQTDRIDLYQSHKDDPNTPLEETLEAYDKLIQAGKVRVVGASNYAGARLNEAMETSGRLHTASYRTLQPEYNLYDRKGFETDLQPVAERWKLGVIPYFSLAAGFLTGKYKTVKDTEGASRGAKVSKYFDARGERILKALNEVSAAAGTKQATVALAWLMAQPTVVAPIASATSVEQLEDLLKAVDLKLEPEQLAKLTEASAY